MGKSDMEDDQISLIKLCEKIYESSRRLDNFIDVMIEYMEDAHDIKMCHGCAKKLDKYTYCGERVYYCGSCRG